ncbi:MAG: T9SS type A sorting domain-containing protein, partial [Flavobacteriaceae bacterium]|nr:T9SS type A sorting domain-containing protein [Flavobacteriaceae bacterium]
VGHSNNSNNQNRNFDVRELYYETAAPVTSTQFTANAPTAAFLNGTSTEIATFWLYTLQNGSGYASWVQAGNTNLAVQPGYGFTMKGNGGSGQNYDFRGRPNTGAMSINIGAGGNETLTGNPYPSALDVKLFLIDAGNSALDGNTYYWQQQAVGTHYLEEYQGGYSTYAPGSPANLADNGTYTVATFIDYTAAGLPDLGSYGTSTVYSAISTRYAPIGQGFMVRGVANGTASFSNNMRVYQPEGANSTFRFAASDDDDEDIHIPLSHNGIDYENIILNPTSVPELKIHTQINNQYFRENIIAFRNASTPEYDKFMDGHHPSLLSADTYFATNTDGHDKLVINSIEFNEDERVPFALYVADDQQGANFKVSLNRIDNFADDLNVYVYDKEQNTYTDIQNGEFSINLPAGDHKDRFEIVFKQHAQDQIDDVIVDVIDTFDIFQDNNNGVLTIKNPELIDINEVAVFDTAGKRVFSKTSLPTQEFYSFPSNNLSDGIYIVRLLTTDNVDISEKVSVYNRK